MTEPNAPEFRQVCQLTGEIADPTTDVAARAKAANAKLHEVCAATDEMLPLRLAVAIEELAAVVPELVAEVERLRGVDDGTRPPRDGSDAELFWLRGYQAACKTEQARREPLDAELERLRGVAAQAAVALHWYMTGIPEQPPNRERIIQLIADLETR